MKKEKIFRSSIYATALVGLAAFLVFSILAAVTFGNADLSLKDVYSVILYKISHIKSMASYSEGAIHDVVWLIRLPRVLLALAVGMALSVCGVVMQAIVQNPWQILMYLEFLLVLLSGQLWRSCLESAASLEETP